MFPCYYVNQTRVWPPTKWIHLFIHRRGNCLGDFLDWMQTETLCKRNTQHRSKECTESQSPTFDLRENTSVMSYRFIFLNICPVFLFFWQIRILMPTIVHVQYLMALQIPRMLLSVMTRYYCIPNLWRTSRSAYKTPSKEELQCPVLTIFCSQHTMCSEHEVWFTFWSEPPPSLLSP